jgi:ADP-ribose pyrophosphatase
VTELATGVDDLQRWDVLESHMTVDERWCKIRRDKVRLPDGSVLDDYFLAIRPNIVVVLALSANLTIPLVRQYKHGVGQVTLELPAGTFSDEAPDIAGKRELLEETGWGAECLICVGEFFDDASKNTNLVYSLVGLNAQKQTDNRELDATEASSGLEVLEVRVDELQTLLFDGTIRAQSSVASAYQALTWLKKGGYI